jgi:hypothetical protein
MPLKNESAKKPGHYHRQLSSKDRQHRSRSLCQVFWKRSEISHRTELHREAESIVIAAIHGNETAIAVIQVEIARYVL